MLLTFAGTGCLEPSDASPRSSKSTSTVSVHSRAKTPPPYPNGCYTASMGLTYPPSYERLRAALDDGKLPVVVVLEPYTLTYGCSYTVKPDSPICVGSPDERKHAQLAVVRHTMEFAQKNWKRHAR